jgi:hypothetical protein
MRKLFFIIFLSTSFSLCAQQVDYGIGGSKAFQVFDAGLEIGVNASQVDGDNLAGFNKIGLTTGVIANVNFSKNWFLSFELLYTQKGSHTAPGAYNTYTLKMNYAEVPVLFNYNDRNRLLFGAGLAYGRLFGTKEYINGYENTIEDGTYFTNELSYILSGTFLAGQKKNIGINFRYQGSITSVGKSSNVLVSGLVNRLICLKGIYYF